MPPLEHSKLGASSADRWMKCPASVRLSEGLQDEATTYANEGSAAHELAEMCLRSWTNAHDHLGTIIEHGGDSFIVDVDMADAVQTYVDVVRCDLMEVLGVDDHVAPAVLLSLLEQQPEVYFGIENRFQLDWLDPILFGTNDAYIGDPLGVLRVYDYKHGAGVAVTAPHNAQLMYYALGCLGQNNLRLYHTVELVIVQPRCWQEGGASSRWSVSVEDLYQWGYQQLLPAAKHAQEPDTKCVAGEKQCRWCRVNDCATLAEANMSLVCAAFGDEGTSPVVMPPTAERLTSDELGQVNTMIPLFESWLRSVKAEIAVRLKAGGDPDTLKAKLVKKRSKRAWEDVGAAQTALLDHLGNDVMNVTLKSPAQIEKVVKNKLKGRKHTPQRNEVLEWVSKFVTKPDTGFTVVALGDAREAIPPSEAFGDYSEPED